MKFGNDSKEKAGPTHKEEQSISPYGFTFDGSDFFVEQHVAWSNKGLKREKAKK